MYRLVSRTRPATWMALLCTCLLLYLSACSTGPAQPSQTNATPTQQATSDMAGTTPQATTNGIGLQVPGHYATPTTTPKSTTATPAAQTAPVDRPVLAFYYMWYHQTDWSLSKMSDLPSNQYISSDDATVDRQVTMASNAGITGFISSWWGPGDQTDQNFVKLLAHSATLQNRTHAHFASTVYFECDAPGLNTIGNIVTGLRYLSSHYANNPNFFHWQGKPVLFFWKPLDNGRTLAQWAAIRSQVDPNNQMIWSAEGVDTTLLDVFDGIHLFSAGYWGLLSNTMTAVDQGFRTKVDTYNKANGTHKIWAAGVEPGYNDTHVAGRVGTYIVPRNNGATYATSWTAAMASQPEWITITSFNEWFEGAMIEPSVTYGNQYLSLTQQFAREWHG